MPAASEALSSYTPQASLLRRETRFLTPPGDILAAAFARTVGRSSEARVRWLASGWRRRPILAGIFRQMPRQLDRRKASGVHAVADWNITGAPGGGTDRFQLRIEDGGCRVIRRPDGPAQVVLELDGADFLRLVAGAADGAELFMSGRLRVEGDLMLTARLPTLFRFPPRPRERG